MTADAKKYMAASLVRISVAVFEGEPMDYQKYRHTSLFFEFANREPSFLAHVVGPPEEYEFQTRDGYDPSQSQSIAKVVEVGTSLVEVRRAQMVEILRTIPVKIWDLEFNCQMWVETALKRLSELRMLSEDAYAKGVDGMVDAIAEAADEED